VSGAESHRLMTTSEAAAEGERYGYGITVQQVASRDECLRSHPLLRAKNSFSFTTAGITNSGRSYISQEGQR